MKNVADATRAVAGGELTVKWPNGWVNTYRRVEGATTLNGTARSPGGQQYNITLIRQ